MNFRRLNNYTFLSYFRHIILIMLIERKEKALAKVCIRERLQIVRFGYTVVCHSIAVATLET